MVLCFYQKKPWRHLKEVLRKSPRKRLEDVAKTSQKRHNFGLKNVLDCSEIEVMATFFKTFSRRLPGHLLTTCLKKTSSWLPFQINIKRFWDQNYDVSTASLGRLCVGWVTSKNHPQKRILSVFYYTKILLRLTLQRLTTLKIRELLLTTKLSKY